MRPKLSSVALTFGALTLLSLQARAAEPQCGVRDKVVERLATTYGETRRSMGLANNSTVMEVYASDKTGSWTITVTLPNGLTCLVASGDGFEALAETLPAKGSQV